MSGLGVGAGLILGALAVPFAAIGVAAYAAGAIVVGGSRLMYRSGKAAHDLYVRKQEEKRERIRVQLEAVEGAMGELALSTHEAMTRAAVKADMDAEKARVELLKQSDAVERRIIEAKGGAEETFLELGAYIRESEARTERMRTAEAEAFTGTLNASRARCEAAFREVLAKDSKQLEEKLAAVRGMAEKQEAIYREYAERKQREGMSLLRILERAFDCEALARGSYSMARSIQESLAESIRTGNWSAAATEAAMYAQTLHTLQMELEYNDSQLQALQMKAARAADQLEAVVKASHDILGKDAPEEITYYVNEKCDADFWSEGRLSTEWKEAASIVERLHAVRLDDMEIIEAEIVSAEETIEKIKKSYARARQLISAEELMFRLLGEVDSSMEDIGWTRVGDAEYVAVDKNGKYTASGDPRSDLMVRFENAQGDAQIMLLRKEFCEAEGTYRVWHERLTSERDDADEIARASNDQAYNQALLERTNLPESFGLSCKAETIGLKREI